MHHGRCTKEDIRETKILGEMPQYAFTDTELLNLLSNLLGKQCRKVLQSVDVFNTAQSEGTLYIK